MQWSPLVVSQTAVLALQELPALVALEDAQRSRIASSCVEGRLAMGAVSIGEVVPQASMSYDLV
jgi:hypothetical protein